MTQFLGPIIEFYIQYHMDIPTTKKIVAHRLNVTNILNIYSVDFLLRKVFVNT